MEEDAAGGEIMTKKELAFVMPTANQLLRMANDKSYADGFKDGYIMGATISFGVATAVATRESKKEVRK